MKTHHIIIGVHGIRTGHENWSDDFRRHNEPLHPEISIEEYDYGSILGVQMYACAIAPFLGWNMIDDFYKWIKLMLKNYPKGTPYSIASHSFGTWLTHGLLYRHKNITPEGVAIIGSVLSEYYSKTQFPLIVRRKQFDRMLVMWSKEDSIIKHLSNFPFGKNGVKGFIDSVPGCITQFERTGGHSNYFSEKEKKKTYDTITNFFINGNI